MPDIRPAVISISGLNGAKLSPVPYLPDQGRSREFTVVDNNRSGEWKSTDSEVIHIEHSYSSMLSVLSLCVENVCRPTCSYIAGFVVSHWLPGPYLRGQGVYGFKPSERQPVRLSVGW